MIQKKTYDSVLSIAGSDSGGCAGIQADIKSISACGGYAATVITASTAQNTTGVFDIFPMSINHIENQLEAVMSDINFGAIKVGMLNSCEIIDIVTNKLILYKQKNIVIDPVMVSSSGHKLISDSAIVCLKKMLPFSKIVTPNIPEAELLIGKVISYDNMPEITVDIGNKYRTSVLLKGGHYNFQEEYIFDFLYLHDSKKIIKIKNPKIKSKNIHGTGCSLSSSIATYLSKGLNIENSVKNACKYVNKSIRSGANIILGKGKGPINHFDL